MKMIELTCRKCGGILKADIDNLYTYCPYCGQKLLFDLDQIELVFAEKEKTKREQEVTKRAQLDHEYAERKEMRDNAALKKLGIGLAAFIFLDFLFIFIMSLFE